MTITKYRPYFTAEELSEIILCLKSNPTPRRLQLIRYLESFRLKIDHGVINAAHTSAPDISERLGFAELPAQSPAIIGEAAYQKQLVNPKSCTPHEINAALQHRYTNNLMSAEEEKEYETKVLGL